MKTHPEVEADDAPLLQDLGTCPHLGSVGLLARRVRACLILHSRL